MWLLLAMAVAYAATGLAVSRWAWRSGKAQNYAWSFEDEPFSPGFIAFSLIWTWPAVALSPLVRWFYGSRP